MGRVTARMIGLAAFVLCATPALADSYGAIAVDAAAGAFGASVHSSKDEAERRATAECKANGGGSACDEEIWVHNGCIAFASASKTAWGVGAKGTEADAEAGAMGKCIATGGTEATCKSVIQFCVK